MTPGPVPLPRTSPEHPSDERRVVVGVDGSAASVRALMWALELAGSTGSVVEVVTAWPLHAPVFIGEVPGHFNDARWQAVQAQHRVIEHALELVCEEAGGVVKRVENARPLDALVNASVGAAMVVVGARPSTSAHSTEESTLAEALQSVARCQVFEVSAYGVVLLPRGPYEAEVVGSGTR